MFRPSLFYRFGAIIPSRDLLSATRSVFTGSSYPISLAELSQLSDPVFLEKTRLNLKARACNLDLPHLVDLHQRYRSGEHAVQSELLELFRQLPNSTHPLTPVGDPSKFREILIHGAKREATFKLLDAVTLTNERTPPFSRSDSAASDVFHPGGHLRLKNVSTGAGQKTYYFGGPLALLESALVNFTLSRLAEAGFSPVSVPDILPEPVIQACGFPTRGVRSQVYKLSVPEGSMAYCLSGTSEMALAGFCAGKVFQGKTPVGFCAASRCYRQEAPNQEPPLYRVHQFTKVEMFGVTAPEFSSGEEMFDNILNLQTKLFADLGLHFRVLEMPTSELGNSAHRKVDIEAWMPGEGIFGEISSTSNCLDYQAKRLGVRWMTSDGEKHAYTLNGTGCAIPRIVKAILETHQNRDRSVTIPEVLLPFMPGREELRCAGCDISFRPLSTGP